MSAPTPQSMKTLQHPPTTPNSARQSTFLPAYEQHLANSQPSNTDTERDSHTKPRGSACGIRGTVALLGASLVGVFLAALLIGLLSHTRVTQTTTVNLDAELQLPAAETVDVTSTAYTLNVSLVSARPAVSTSFITVTTLVTPTASSTSSSFSMSSVSTVKSISLAASPSQAITSTIATSTSSLTISAESKSSAAPKPLGSSDTQFPDATSTDGPTSGTSTTLETPTSAATSGGSVLLCAEAGYSSTCENIEYSSGECKALPATLRSTVQSAKPDEGYSCTLYLDSDCLAAGTNGPGLTGSAGAVQIGSAGLDDFHASGKYGPWSSVRCTKDQ